MTTAPLTLHETTVAGVTVLQLRGALQHGNTGALEQRLALLLVRLRSPLVIDLSAVETCDAAGAAVLVGAARAASPATPVRLAGPNEATRAALRTAGVVGALPAFGSVAGAAQADPADLHG